MRKFSLKICAFIVIFSKIAMNRGRKCADFRLIFGGSRLVRQPLFSYTRTKAVYFNKKGGVGNHLLVDFLSACLAHIFFKRGLNSLGGLKTMIFMGGILSVGMRNRSKTLKP